MKAAFARELDKWLTCADSVLLLRGQRYYVYMHVSLTKPSTIKLPDILEAVFCSLALYATANVSTTRAVLKGQWERLWPRRGDACSCND